MIFSVVIPVHNKLPHLNRSINSVLNQTFNNFELLLIDDASTDGSREKLLEFNDDRIRRFRREQPGPGGYAARNLGIINANGQWICFLDADDEWELNYLEKVNNIIEAHEQAEIIVTNYQIISSSELGRKKLTEQKINSDFFSLTDFFNNNNIMWTSATSIKKEILLEAGLFPEKKFNRGGDMDTWIRCLDKSSMNIKINNVLAYYYRDTVNQVTDKAKNPYQDFYLKYTLQEIRENSQDKVLLKAIDSFCYRHLYNLIIGKMISQNDLDLSNLSLIHNKFTRNKLLLKVVAKSIILNLFGKRGR